MYGALLRSWEALRAAASAPSCQGGNVGRLRGGCVPVVVQTNTVWVGNQVGLGETTVSVWYAKETP